MLLSCNDKNSDNYTSSLKELNVPCQEGGEANLFVSETGDVYLSWVEYLSDTTDALVYSKLANEQWTQAKTIASGSDWFVNWADFPSLVVSGKENQYMAAHWLQKSADGTYDYDIHISQSFDGGNTWQKSFIPHRDSISAEHGFVSMLPISLEKILVTWLDGRNTKIQGEVSKSHGHGHHGSMTLRTAIFDKNANLTEEDELDNRICDCCQTSIAMTDQGAIIAYRDRSDNEIRDISIVRKVNGKWTQAQTVFEDNWKITGCPVNGPAIDAKDNNVVVAWYTMDEGQPQVRVSFSNNSGEHFSKPIFVDNGNPLGRVDVVMISGNMAIVSWLEQTGDDDAAIKIVRVNEEGIVGDKNTVALSTSSRQSGFPRMVIHENHIILAWTKVDSLSKVNTVQMKLK